MAIDLEIAKICNFIDQKRCLEYKGICFHVGKIADTEVVLAKSGVGKVNAAYTTTLMIERFNPSFIISSGIAGGLNRLKVLDVLVAWRLCQHDVDTSMFGDDYGYIDGVNRVYLEADAALTNVLVKSAENAVRATLATGDQFIANDQRASFITKTFDAYGCDMESGAIAHVCHLAKVRIGVVRVISDGGNDDAKLTFEEFKEKAAEKNSQIVISAVKEIQKYKL